MKKHWPLIILIVLYFSFIAYKLVAHPTPFYDWDESLYVQTGKEMIEQKKFLLPVWQGAYWLDKPPLIPLIYGIIIKLSFSLPAEITTRLFNLTIACLVLILVYIFYQKIIKNSLFATLVTAITALTPLFLQRAQTVNLDIFILLSWIGYVLFFSNFWISLFFFFIGVMAKSLIGFYPVAIMFFYQLWQLFTKKTSWEKSKKIFLRIVVQTSIMMLWFVAMFMVFGKQFWLQHIIESHFRRVTSSIEFHFGQRIFYITEAFDQMGYFFWLAIVGGLIIFLRLLKEKRPGKEMLISFYLLPWFIFLNLTKTKIFWYFLPAIPQFAFLAVVWIKQIKVKSLAITLGIFLLVILIYQSFIKQNVLAITYSKPEPYYYLSLYAKGRCSELNVLMDKSSRESFATLDKLGLLITTTKWWGNHPSMVYYFGKKVNYIFEESTFTAKIKSVAKEDCFMIDKNDQSLIDNKKLIDLKNFDDFYLYKTSP